MPSNVLGGKSPRASLSKAGCGVMTLLGLTECLNSATSVPGRVTSCVDARLSGALNMLSLMRKVVGAATEDDEEVCTSRCLHPDPTPGQDSR